MWIETDNNTAVNMDLCQRITHHGNYVQFYGCAVLDKNGRDHSQIGLIKCDNDQMATVRYRQILEMLKADR